MPTWTSQSDFDAERDNAGTVHDADSDHPGAGTLASGYLYGGIDDVYPALQGVDLVGWWPLHEQSGQANDLSGSGNHGTVTGATQGVAGRGGLQAYSFDGSDDEVSTGVSTINFPASWAFWVRTRRDGSTEYVAGNWNSGSEDILFRHGSASDTWDFLFDQAGSVIGISQTVNQWTHFGVVVDGNGITVYKDGASVGTDATGFTGTSTTGQNWRIGTTGSSAAHFQGEVCDFRYYDRALTASEIQTLYEWGSGDYAVPPDNNDGGVSYYDFNAANANDQWGTNDGVVNGATHVADGGPRADGAYSFDGVDDYIEISDNALGASSYTLSYWTRHDSPSDGGIDYDIFLREDNHVVQLRDDGNGNYNFYHRITGPSNVSVGTTISSGVWTHFAAMWDDTDNEIRLYKNGALEGSATAGSTTGDLAGFNFLGAQNATPSKPLDGAMDEIRFFTRALEPWEVAELYQYGTLGRDMRAHTVGAT